MITVSILINGHPIYTRSAINRSAPGAKGPNRYVVDTGESIMHDPKDGAVELAKKMLDTINLIVDKGSDATD